MQYNDHCVFFVCSAEQVIVFADPILPGEMFKPGTKIKDLFNVELDVADNTVLQCKYGTVVFFPLFTNQFNGFLGVVFPPDLSNDTMKIIMDKYKQVCLENEVIRKSAQEMADSFELVGKEIHVGTWYMAVTEKDWLNSNNPVTWTGTFRAMLGFSDEMEFPGILSSWLDRIHPADKPRVVRAFAAHFTDCSGNTPLDIEYKLCLKNAEYCWFRTTGTTTRDEQGRPVRFVGSLFDINDRKIKEEEMRFLVTRLDLISRALTEGPWDMEIVAGGPINPQNKIWWSPQFRKILGYKDENDFPNVLSSWSESLHPEDKERTLKAFYDHINDYSGGTPFDIEYRLRLKNGEYRWFHAHGSCMRDDKGVPLRVAGTIRDIEHKIRKFRESEEKLNRYCEIVNTLTKKQGLEANLQFISPEMQSLVKNIEKYAKVDAPILITGESGVGKEVVADLIHHYSDRKDAAFYKINCGAIPETLLESELFGYEEGAFSGAKKGGKIGIFELVDNGTVLLDEIGDLPLPMQVKILRFVQSRDFYRVGGNHLIKVNTRIIAATNRDLDAMVQKKEFRSDLFYRLRVLAIHIPALRERPSDILPLTQHFLKKFNEKYRTNKTFLPEVYRIFTQYTWKGNVRELENLMERLIVTTDTDTITAEWIPDEIRKCAATEQEHLVDERIRTYKEAKEEFEQQYFRQAIEAYGSTRKVAEKIRLDHSTIVKKAAKYGIDLLHWQRG